VTLADDHREQGANVAPFLLGALDGEERERFAAHLAVCPLCQEESDRLRTAVHALPSTVPAVEAPPELRSRIMSEVDREAALLRAAGAEADQPGTAPPRRRRWRIGSWELRPALAMALAVSAFAAAVAVGVLVGNGGSAGSGRTVAAAVSSAPGGQAELRVRDGRGELVVQRFPEPPSGRVYQVWLQRPGGAPQPTDALFVVDRAGAAHVAVPGDLNGVKRVMVTDEPRGGSRAPTGKPVIVATLS
jgi:anti-sigma-K factor RskA